MDNSNDFVVKEFSLVTKNIRFTDVIKSSGEFEYLGSLRKKSVEWLTKNHHGFQWGDGSITVGELVHTIDPIVRNKIVYVRGEEKAKWLQKILSSSANKYTQNVTINNIESIGFVHTRKTHQKNHNLCSKHKEMAINRVCALRNAMEMMIWHSEQDNETRTHFLF